MMRPMIESMESRRLLAATPVVAITMSGTGGQVTGVILTFGVPLDPASAQNVDAYSVSKKTKGDDSSPVGGSDGDTRRVQFRTAAYDPATQSVTLTPTEPFDLGRKFRRLRVTGSGTNAVRTATGAPIDGDGDGQAGGNAVIHSRVIRAGGFTFREADGDRARLRLAGPGALRVWSDARRNIPPVIFLVGTNPARSTLTGSVIRARRTGDGVVTIREISQTTLASVPLLTNPAFNVQVVNP